MLCISASGWSANLLVNAEHGPELCQELRGFLFSSLWTQTTRKAPGRSTFPPQGWRVQRKEKIDRTMLPATPAPRLDLSPIQARQEHPRPLWSLEREPFKRMARIGPAGPETPVELDGKTAGATASAIPWPQLPESEPKTAVLDREALGCN